jgi:all-trans-retinol dehydrogenase (NAD+)
VTGGCSGIGELLVKKLVKKGVKVAVLDIQQLPPSLQSHPSVQFFACDVTDANAVSKTAEQVTASMGSPSILVNNVGIAQAHTIFDTTPEYLHKIFAVNLFSNWYTVQAFLPDMIAKNKGHIVTVASIASFTGVAGMADYCATKAAVLSFHEGMHAIPAIALPC